MKDCKNCSGSMPDGPNEYCAVCHIEGDLRDVSRSIKKLSAEKDMWRDRALKAEATLTLLAMKGAA